MREVAFLRKNVDKWKSFEELLKKNTKSSSDQLADLYIELNNDLAFAQSLYPNSKTSLYLNDLSIQAHNKIYKNKKEKSGRIITFWTQEIPELFSYKLKELSIAFLVFIFFCAVGAISQLNDPSFARLILGDGYVNLTMSNIENQDPLAIYKMQSQLDMFFQITFNNIRVSFIVFAFGLCTALGSGYYLLKNGIMVGTFISFFSGYDLLSESMMVIFIHGALELSAIAIAGAAGFVLGNSFIFPGTYKRSTAFIKGAKEGLKMLISLVPVFIMAGFLESYVTRYTEMPFALSLLIIITSFTFIIGYYIYLPTKLYLKRKKIYE